MARNSDYQSSHSGKKGYTLGKRLLKMRLVSQDNGRPVGVGKSIVRSFAHLIDAILIVGWIWPWWDSQRQTFADKVCETVVVMDYQKLPPEHTSWRRKRRHPPRDLFLDIDSYTKDPLLSTV